MTDAVLVIAWLVLAHLVADFVLQNDWIALNKGTGGRTGWAALGVHGLHVGLCLVPFVLAYGPPALAYLVVVMGTHVVVDRWKVRATRRAGRIAVDAARRRPAGTGSWPASGLGAAWTPWPALLFLADQVLHLAIALVGWLVILDGVPLLGGWIDVVNLVLRAWDRAVVHAAVLTGVVLVSLFLLNTRAAYYLVLAFTSPRDIPSDAPGPEPDGDGPDHEATRPEGRIGATIGALERLLIAGFVLAGAEAAAGLLVVATTIARFRELRDRGVAQAWLLGTLASVSVAVFGAVVARAALGTIP